MCQNIYLLQVIATHHDFGGIMIKNLFLCGALALSFLGCSGDKFDFFTSIFRSTTYTPSTGQSGDQPDIQKEQICLYTLMAESHIGDHFVFLPDSGYELSIRDSLVITHTKGGFSSELYLRGSKQPEVCTNLAFADGVFAGRNESFAYNYKLSAVGCNRLIEEYVYDLVGTWEGPTYWSLKEDKNCLIDLFSNASTGQCFTLYPDSGFYTSIRDSLVICKTSYGISSALYLRGSKMPETCSNLQLVKGVLTARNDNLPYTYYLDITQCNVLIESYKYDNKEREGVNFWSMH
jgi:hypothetical protein